MASASKNFVFCLLLIVGMEALKLPDYIKPCSRNDPQFNECALKNGKDATPILLKGDRKLGVPVMDPLFIETASVTHAGIEVTVINCTVVGAKSAKLEGFSIDFDRELIKLSIRGSRITMTGWYNINGSLLGLPLYGQGACHVVVDNPHGNYSTNYTLTRSADGEQYVVLGVYDAEAEVDGLTVKFENLFNGNKLLGDAMNSLINENWRIFMQDIGKPLFKVLGGIVHHILTNVFQKFPYNELFPK